MGIVFFSAGGGGGGLHKSKIASKFVKTNSENTIFRSTKCTLNNFEKSQNIVMTAGRRRNHFRPSRPSVDVVVLRRIEHFVLPLFSFPVLRCCIAGCHTLLPPPHVWKLASCATSGAVSRNVLSDSLGPSVPSQSQRKRSVRPSVARTIVDGFVFRVGHHQSCSGAIDWTPC